MNHNVIEALETIRDRNDGVLRPADVVEHAQRPESPLHGYFEWDDSEAAAKYRLYQARQLLARVTIKKPAGAGEEVEIRLYHSLTGDRTGGGGYRQVDDVLADEQKRADLMATALGEFQALQRKYEQLERLAPVFRAITKVAEEFEAKEANGKRGRKGGEAEARPTP